MHDLRGSGRLERHVEAWGLIGPVTGLPVAWSAFAATALGVLVCGVVFASITVQAAGPGLTSDETRL